MELYSIETGNFKLDGGAMFGVVPKVIWNKLYPSDENNQCNWAMRSLLIVDGNRKVLIDSGIGDKQDAKFFSNYYLNGDDSLEKSLNRIGFSMDDITDNIITHLHFDHCGGSIKYDENKNLVPAFKNATFWISEKQWNWATKPNRRERASFLRENILPIQESGKLNLIKDDSKITDNISIRQYHGHTDGQVIPFINFMEKTIVYMGDLLPAAAHIPLPYIMSYDTRPLLTLDEKEVFLNEAAKNGYILFFEHDLYNECCTVAQTEKGVRVKDVFKLNELIKNNK